MQTFAQPSLYFRGRSTTPKTPAHLPVRPQARFEHPAGLSFDDVRIRYASGREQHTGHKVTKGQEPAAVQLQAMPGQDVVQLCDYFTLHPNNYIGVDNATLGEAAGRVAATNRNQANRQNQFRYNHSEILRASLVQNFGVIDPNLVGIRNQAHHIVETSNKYGQQLLNQYGIHPDSAVNGVLLPTCDTDDTGDASVHRGSHSTAYTAGVNAALDKAVEDARTAAPQGQQAWFQERTAVIRTLHQIRDVLLTQNVPLNRSSDPTFNPVTESGETIADIFHRMGLT